MGGKEVFRKGKKKYVFMNLFFLLVSVLSAAVVLRLAKSWFRIGSLEILTKNKELDLLK